MGRLHLHFTGFYGILRYAKLPTSYHELFAKVPRIKCNSHLNSTSFQRNPPVHEYYTSIDLSKHITLDSPEMVLKSMYPIMKGLEHKEYWVIFTNRLHTHIKTIRHTIGSHESLLDVRIILRQAIELNATGIILVSNSVDGSVEPTLRDIEYTKKTPQSRRTPRHLPHRPRHHLRLLLPLHHRPPNPPHHHRIPDNSPGSLIQTIMLQ